MDDTGNKLDLGIFSGKRILLTGDTGFKGSWLALWLSELGAHVTGLSLPSLPSNVLFPALRPLIHHIDGDIRDLQVVTRATKQARPDFVFHMAAQSLVRQSYIDPQTTFATNVLGSTNLLEAVRQAEGIRALIYVTTDKCYRSKETPGGYREDDELGGRDPYSASKACAELVFQAYRESFLAQREGLGAASARAGNVIGGGDRAADRIIPDTIAALEAGRPAMLRNPGHVRSWLHVLDPLYGYLKLAASLARDPARFSGSWNFGPGKEAMRSVEDLVGAVIAAWGSGKIAYCSNDGEPHEAAALYLSSEKARRELGWQALWPFERAAAEATLWYRAVGAGRAPLEVTREQIHAYMAELAKGEGGSAPTRA
jgi:CDP-glucose 4,6-dehydratase